MKSINNIIILLLTLCMSVVSSCEMPEAMIPDQSGNGQPEDRPTEDPGNDTGDAPEENTDFIMLFTNDFHSQIEPTDDDRGGVLRLKALVDSVRAVEPHVLLADAGDLVQGTYYFSLLNGVVEMKMLDMLQYDIRTIGNHEFDKKMSGLGEMLALSKVPVVASNYDFSNTNIAQHVVPSKILMAGSIKVGFIGLNVRLLNLVNQNACEGVVWQDAINVADKYAAELREQGADIVIAISHLGYGGESDAYYYDRGVAMRTEHIDMIIGGHSHTTLRKAEYITSLDGDPVPVVQTGSRGYNLGYARISLDKYGKPSFTYRLIPVDSRLDGRIDNSFADIIEDYASEVKEKMNVKLGFAPYEIRRGTPESRLGNLTADGLVWMAKEFHDTDVDVAVYNSGGVRANIPYGDVTLGDVYAVYPFDNTFCMISMKGDALKSLLARAPNSLYVNKEVKITVAGDHITSMTVKGTPIDDSKTYKVASIDYIFDNDSYAGIFSQGFDREDSTEMIRDYFGEYFKYLAEQNNGDIMGYYDGRISIE